MVVPLPLELRGPSCFAEIDLDKKVSIRRCLFFHNNVQSNVTRKRAELNFAISRTFKRQKVKLSIWPSQWSLFAFSSSRSAQILDHVFSQLCQVVFVIPAPHFSEQQQSTCMTVLLDFKAPRSLLIFTVYEELMSILRRRKKENQYFLFDKSLSLAVSNSYCRWKSPFEVPRGDTFSSKR